MNYKIMPYIDEDKIEKRLSELGKEITKVYEGKSLKVVGILKGSVPTLCTLTKNITNDSMEVDYMSVCSYGGSTDSSGVVKIIKDLDKSIENENVLIVEDIIDTGYTIKKLIELLTTRNPKSLRVCALLDKPSRRKVSVKADYVGFEIEDKFIVGYGLDYNQKYRQLPYIGYVEFLDEK